jgi:predicted enzyme related to lactoylglutathione lyase
VSEHVAFTKLVVADLDASARFYTEVFGVREQRRVHAEIAGRPIDEILYDATGPGGATFGLLRYGDATGPASGEVILGIVTTDVAGVVARVAAAGGTVVEAPHAMPEHGVRVAFVTDVEGHLVEVVELLPRP